MMLRKLLTTPFLLGALISTTGVAAADPAPPGACESGPRHDRYQGAWAYCGAGYGFARVWVDCWNEDTFKKNRYYGDWVSVRQTSVKWCNASFPARGSYGYQTRAL